MDQQHNTRTRLRRDLGTMDGRQNLHFPAPLASLSQLCAVQVQVKLQVA